MQHGSARAKVIWACAEQPIGDNNLTAEESKGGRETDESTWGTGRL